MKGNGIFFRNGRFDDIKDLAELERRVWGEEMAAGEDKWQSRLSIFPEGTFVAARKEELIGVSVVHIIDWQYPAGYYPTWHEVTENGYISNHKPDGDVMYGVNMTVISGSPKVASNLTGLSIKMMRKLNISRGLFGCRIPSLRSYIDANQVKKIKDEHVLDAAAKDPEIRFFMQNGLAIEAVKKGYFLPDKDSLGWGVILNVL